MGMCKRREVRGLMREESDWGVASLLSWMKIHCRCNFGAAETDQPRWSSWCGAYRWCWREVVRGDVVTIQISVPELSHLFEEVVRIENIDWARILKVKNTSKNSYRWYDHLGGTLYTISIPSALHSIYSNSDGRCFSRSILVQLQEDGGIRKDRVLKCYKVKGGKTSLRLNRVL